MNGRSSTTLFVLLVLPLAIACSDEATADYAGDDGGERAFVRDSVVAVMNRLNGAATDKDVEAFMALWHQSDSLTYTRSGHTFLGWDEIAAEHTRAFSSPDPWSFVPTEMHVRVLGPDAGIATAFVRATSFEEDGAETNGWFTITLAVENVATGWRVVHAHGSYPPSGSTPRGEPEG